MDLNRLTQDADNLIRKVVSRYNQIYIPSGNISQVELDLMLDDLRKLYDTFKNIGQISLSIQNSIVKPEVTVSIPVPMDSQPASHATPVFSEKQILPVDIETESPKSDPEPTNEIISDITSEHEMALNKASEVKSVPEPEVEAEPVSYPEPEIALVKETEVKSVPAPVNELETAPEKQVLATAEIADIGKPVQDASENNNIVNSDPTPSMLADRYNTVNKSLSETLASSQVQGVMGTRILFQPISDLITGIGLNDKFSFISDLFGNSAAHYDEAIARIDKAVNLDEANWILQKYHTAEWGHKQESLARLKDFIKRRFI